MEKVFSFSEFEEWIKETHPKEIVLLSDYQRKECLTASFEFIFESISVGIRPNVLYLRGKRMFLKLYLVKKISLVSSLSAHGTHFTITCETGNSLQHNTYDIFVR